MRSILYHRKNCDFLKEGTFTLTSSVQDLPVILKLNNFQSLKKALNGIIEQIFCNSNVLYRRKNVKVAIYNFGSVYNNSLVLEVSFKENKITSA